jgi:hypothetical protein
MNRPWWQYALAFSPLAVLLVVGIAAQARSWADGLVTAAFVGGIAVLTLLAWRTGKPPE